MRHTLEHWDDWDERKGRWKTQAENHGEHATPWVAVLEHDDVATSGSAQT
jgi:hypothetical protein